METRELKNSIKNASAYLAQQGFEVPHTRLLEALSRALGERNWSTLRARLEAPVTKPAVAGAEDVVETAAWAPEQGPMSESYFTQCGGNRCPFCGSTEVSSENLEADGPDVFDETTCEACQSTWKTAYRVCGYFGGRASTSAVALANADASNSAGEDVLRRHPFEREDVLVFTYLDGASLKYKAFAYLAEAAWPALSTVATAECTSKLDVVASLYEATDACIEALMDARTTPLAVLEFASAGRAYREMREQVSLAGRQALHAYRKDVVDELIEHVRHMARKYAWRTSSLDNAFDVAAESADILKLEVTTAELYEAATLLS